MSGAKINTKIVGGLLEGRSIHFGKGDNVSGNAKDIERLKKTEDKRVDSSTVNINLEISKDAKIKFANLHAGEGNNEDILKDVTVTPTEICFSDYEGEKIDFKSLLDKAKTVSKGENENQISNLKRYPVQNWGQSQALIFNFMFSNTSEYREGAQHDTANLNKLLTFLGFHVQSVDKDQTEENMKKIVKQFLNSKKVALAPMVLLFIGSHGKQVNETDYFWDANMNLVSVTSIVDMFATKKDFTALQGKPKLFWFQFCRKNEEIKSDCVEKSFIDWYKSQIPSSDDIDDDLSEKLSDMFLAYATLPELKAYRVHDGSWFVMSICIVFFDNAYQDDCEKLFQKVYKAVKEKNSKKCIQICDLKNGLKKSLYFYPQ